MTLIKSISGIRGTIGGQPGDNLTPIDLAKFTSAYAQWLKETSGDKRLTVATRGCRAKWRLRSSKGRCAVAVST